MRNKKDGAYITVYKNIFLAKRAGNFRICTVVRICGYYSIGCPIKSLWWWKNVYEYFRSVWYGHSHSNRESLITYMLIRKGLHRYNWLVKGGFIMFEILNYLRVRYVSEKAQGIVEYALLLAFVVAIAAAVLTANNTDGLGGAISKAFGKVTTQINSFKATGE